MTGMVEVRVEGRLTGLGPDHEAVSDARSELAADLGDLLGPAVAERDVATLRARGVQHDLVVGLTSVGSIGALAGVLKAWIGRDRRRSVTVTDSATGRSVHIEGEAISNEVLVALLTGRPPATSPDPGSGGAPAVDAGTDA